MIGKTTIGIYSTEYVTIITIVPDSILARYYVNGYIPFYVNLARSQNRRGSGPVKSTMNNCNKNTKI